MAHQQDDVGNKDTLTAIRMSDDLPADPSEASLHDCEAALRQAQLASDVRELARLVDDALVFTGPNGAVYSKQDDPLDAHRGGLVRINRLEPSEELIQRFGHVAVVSVRMEMSGTFEGQAFSGPFRYTRVWRAQGDSWRVVAGHVSAVLA
ncbi:MAG: nuclear transport factor 2 family protein [Gemmatimonadota bacterium]|nr:nuclear transport factor 2 family protein [Gemmatimonadota bacterium]